MVTISHIVQNVLQHQVLIQEAINKEIVSYNKLAYYLKPKIELEINKPVKNSAIIMAIKRNTKKIKSNSENFKFPKSIETIRSDICYIVFEESPTILSKLYELYHIVNFKKGGILNIIQGNYEIAVIINKKYKEELLDLCYEEKILETIDNLVSISYSYSKDLFYKHKILHDISVFLAWDNINIIDIILTKTEISIIIKEDDFSRFYRNPLWAPCKVESE